MYHADFRSPGQAQICGEVTPIYMYWRTAIARIAEYNPDMRLIAVLRDPIDRAYSAWNMEVARRNETLPFSDAIKQEGRRLRAEPTLQHRFFSYLDRGLYAQQIERISRHFPRDRIHVLLTEDLNAPVATMQKAAEYLEIDPEPFSRLAPTREHVSSYVEPLSAQARAHLRDFFEPDVRRLEELIQRDLSHWL